MKAKVKKLLEIVKKFRKVKILVVGDIILDEYIFGNADRISPEAPIPVLDVKEIVYVPGGAANTAYNIKALGGQSILAGIIGPEDKGKILKGALKKRGINIKGIIVDSKRKTTLKSRVIAKNQQVVRIDFEDRHPINSQIENRILSFIKKQIKNINGIIISDYAKGVVTPKLSQTIIKVAKDNRILCLVDPKGSDYLKYKNCDIITPNEKELAQALNVQIENEGKFLQAGKMLLSHVLSNVVLVTRGAKGMTLFGRNGVIIYSSAVNKKEKVIDVTGAGDTAIATIALALTVGANLEQAMIIANHACGITVTKAGTAVVLPEELKENLKSI